MSIQLVSRARKAGLVITPRAVFQHQTVAALAAVAGARQETAAALPDVAVGALPATPIMRWLAERGGPIERFNQAMLLQVPAGLREDHLVAALQALLDHHDALRLRLIGRRLAGGMDAWRWRRPVPSRRATACGGSTSAGLDAEATARLHERAGASGRAAACAVRRRDGAGGLVRCRHGASRSSAADHPPSGGRRGVVAHPGAGSGGGLGGDCARATSRRCRRAAPRSGAGRSGLRRTRRSRHGSSELPFWTGDAERAVAVAGRGRARSRRATPTAQPGSSRLTLPAAITVALLTRVPAAFHGGINDVLLTGLVVAIADWCRRHGRGAAEQCGAARSRGSRPRGGVRGRRPVAHGGLVHQPVPGAARSGPARSRRGAWRVVRRSGARSSSSRSSCARCRTAGSAMGCCAISTRRPRRSLRALRRRRSASTIWGASRRRQRRTGPRLPRL